MPEIEEPRAVSGHPVDGDTIQGDIVMCIDPGQHSALLTKFGTYEVMAPVDKYDGTICVRVPNGKDYWFYKKRFVYA